MMKLADIDLFEGSGLRGFGPLGLEGKNPSESGGIFAQIISTTVGLLTVVAAIWFVILFITGAYGIMSAGGDKGQMEMARKRISTAVIGIVVVIVALFIVNLVGYLLGFSLILNPEELIELIGI